MDLTLFSEKIERLKGQIAHIIVGQEMAVDMVLTSMLADGHVLIEGVPGVAKTLLARLIARLVDARFSRVQFTPDLMPSDVLGTTVFNMKTGEFDFHQGPVFSDIVLVDEINRAPAKTQAALFEVMEERQVTIDGTSYKLPEPFLVVATQNPVEQLGTYPLPEAQLDRFMMKVTPGYPGKTEQMTLAKMFLTGELRQPIEPVLTSEELLQCMEEVKAVILKDEVIEYALAIVEATRTEKEVSCGLSPRASLDLLRASQATAFVRGRDFVIPEDVIEIAKVVLPHRLVLTAEAKINHFTGYQVILGVLDRTKRPQ